MQGMFQVCERKVQINSQSFICIFCRNRGILERKKERKKEKKRKERRKKIVGISADSMQTGNKAGTLNNNAASIDFEPQREKTYRIIRVCAQLRPKSDYAESSLSARRNFVLCTLLSIMLGKSMLIYPKYITGPL